MQGVVFLCAGKSSLLSSHKSMLELFVMIMMLLIDVEL